MTDATITRINCQTCGSLQPEMPVAEALGKYPNPHCNWVITHSNRCATCETFAMGGSKSRRVIKVSASTKACDDSCKLARRDTCACICKGHNHGMGKGF